MTPSTITWLQPLILLPGVALLLGSTSTRYQQLHDEVHHLLMDDMPLSPPFIAHLHIRVRLFQLAITALYVAVSLFGLGSVLGVALLPMGEGVSSVVVLVLTGVGIIAVLAASIALVRESFLVTEVLQDHIEHIRSDGGRHHH